MKLLKKLTEKDLEAKSQEEIFTLTIEELKYTDKKSLIDILSKTRTKAIKDQKEAIKEDMKEDVKWQLSLIKLIKSKQTSEKVRQRAFDDIVEFLSKQDVVLSKELLLESYSLFRYAFGIKDPKAIDTILKARTKMVETMDSKLFSKLLLRHAKVVDELIKLDAEMKLDYVSKKHIVSAIDGEYGDLTRLDGRSRGMKYYRSLYISTKKDTAKSVEQEGGCYEIGR